MSREDRLREFVAWTQCTLTGDEKGQAQIFLDRLFQAFGQPGSLGVGGQPEFRAFQPNANQESLDGLRADVHLGDHRSANAGRG